MLAICLVEPIATTTDVTDITGASTTTQVPFAFSGIAFSGIIFAEGMRDVNSGVGGRKGGGGVEERTGRAATLTHTLSATRASGSSPCLPLPGSQKLLLNIRAEMEQPHQAEAQASNPTRYGLCRLTCLDVF